GTGHWHGLFLYIDGQQVAGPSGPPAGNYGNSMYKVNIGGGGIYDPTGNWFRGQMDDVRIYNRALTAEEIKALNPPKLQAYQPQPANGDRAVSAPLLRWTAGDKAVLHDVYLGTEADLMYKVNISPRTFAPMYYHAPGLQPGTTYYWRVDEIEADQTTIHTGNVWSFTAQALTAYLPNPQDGDASASPAGTLSWLPGRNASQHRVYLSDSRDAIAQGAADVNKGEQKETTFTPTGLAQTTTYYWRVDEVIADGTVQTGPVWSFTTFLPVDDFESYTDDVAAKTTIFDTWIDGLTNGLSGSVVGNATAPFAEQKVVHGGKQSMPLDYNNVASPFYSEAEREFATAQDWTVGEVDTLVLFVRGKLSNGPAPLYFVAQDSSNHTAVVLHPDAAVVRATRWTEWKIPLTSFTGVNLAKIKKIAAGVGDKTRPASGGAGRIFVDDIYVRKSTPEQ
ncbi:MAG: LamG domain-containing protein, partial [Planctomycetes bacterium]|nr:LamG domain-containing protein [Planctomycetota bacterium]